MNDFFLSFLVIFIFLDLDNDKDKNNKFHIIKWIFKEFTYLMQFYPNLMYTAHHFSPRYKRCPCIFIVLYIKHGESRRIRKELPTIVYFRRRTPEGALAVWWKTFFL